MSNLSPQEIRLMDGAASGLTDEAIAKQLGISIATVRGYWQRIRSKLGGVSRSELVAQWLQSRADLESSRIAGEHADALAAMQAGFDSESKRVEKAHQKTIAGMQADFDERLANERSAMSKIYGKTSAKQDAEIAEYRRKADEGTK